MYILAVLSLGFSPFAAELSKYSVGGQARRGLLLPRRGTVAAPSPLTGILGMAEPIVALFDLAQSREKVLPILIILVNRPLFISPRGYMIHSTGIFDA